MSLSGETSPLRWSNERYLALVEAGVIPEGPGIELIDGQLVVQPPQGALHQFSFFALQRAFAALGLFEHGLAVQTTVVLQEDNTYDPEFALLRAEYNPSELPRDKDVLWAVEVSVSSRRTDLGDKKVGYAAAGIPEYWVVDAAKRGIWIFTDAVDGEYRKATFHPAGETMPVPHLDATLDTGAIFPTP